MAIYIVKSWYKKGDNEPIWVPKTWNGLSTRELSYLSGNNVWTDGNNIYYSRGSMQKVLNRSTSTWCDTTWNGTSDFIDDFWGGYVWTDGNDIYFSYTLSNKGIQRTLNKATSTWSRKQWGSTTMYDTIIRGDYICNIDEHIYFTGLVGSSYRAYELNKTESKWSSITFKGHTGISGYNVWTDGTNTYHSSGEHQYLLYGTSYWDSMQMLGDITNTYLYGQHIWTDGKKYYYSYNNGSTQFQMELDNDYEYAYRRYWYNKIWEGNYEPKTGGYVWTDGDNIYYSGGENQQYVLTR